MEKTIAAGIVGFVVGFCVLYCIMVYFDNNMFLFWRDTKKNHPVLYEVIQWGILALALAALIK